MLVQNISFCGFSKWKETASRRSEQDKEGARGNVWSTPGQGLEQFSSPEQWAVLQIILLSLPGPSVYFLLGAVATIVQKEIQIGLVGNPCPKACEKSDTGALLIADCYASRFLNHSLFNLRSNLSGDLAHEKSHKRETRKVTLKRNMKNCGAGRFLYRTWFSLFACCNQIRRAEVIPVACFWLQERQERERVGLFKRWCKKCTSCCCCNQKKTTQCVVHTIKLQTLGFVPYQPAAQFCK